MRFFNFFHAYMVQKYQNESAPIFYYGKSPKTNRKHLKIPYLQALTLGHVKKNDTVLCQQNFLVYENAEVIYEQPVPSLINLSSFVKHGLHIWSRARTLLRRCWSPSPTWWLVCWSRWPSCWTPPTSSRSASGCPRSGARRCPRSGANPPPSSSATRWVGMK